MSPGLLPKHADRKAPAVFGHPRGRKCALAEVIGVESVELILI
jgi:hypothetical protein